MKLITWFGTIVRVERATGKRIHAPLWPLRDIADDLELDIPWDRADTLRVLPGDTPTIVQSAPTGRGVQLLQANKFLSAQPGIGDVEYTRAMPRPSEIFLPLTAAEIARLRDVLGCGWTIIGTGEVVAPGDVMLVDAFVFLLGSVRVPLEAGVPMLDVSGQVLTSVLADGSSMQARRGAARAGRTELLLSRQAPPAPEAATAAEFARGAAASLTIRGGTEYGFLPLTARLSDQAWMHTRSWRTGCPTLGPYEAKTRIVREREKFVLMTDGQEGIIFDEQGVSNEGGYLMNHWVHQRGTLMREGNNVFIDRTALDAAPYLHGCYAMFFNGNLSNYYHWTIDSLLPLFIMRPSLPTGAKLLIPRRIADLRAKPGIVDHMAALREWGFGDMEMVEVPPPVCRVEEVVWVDQVNSIDIVAETLTAARAHVWSRLGPRRAARRIYVRRRGSRSVLNEAAVEAMLTELGFEVVEMEDLTPRAQMETFRDASYVVATHGAAVSNILYCAPGTRVLEIFPDTEYRSAYAELSDKLGLIHAVLSGPVDTDDFHGKMAIKVDTVALGHLLQQLQSWT